MKIYLYNTLNRKKEEFKPIKDKEVKIYSCGPTVYNRAHIGNLKTYIFNDTLRKLFKYNGYKVKQLMNITDVGHLVSDGDTGEDKMILASRREGKTPEEIARYYEKLFFEDMKELNIEYPEQVVRATDEIADMEEYVKTLLEKGFAYETSNTIYFDTSKLDKYGVLSEIVIDDEENISRIEEDTEKRNLTDFALWIKAPENHIMKWDSFFGEAYPGWHLECSVISEKHLGKPFDIHTGGVDHIRFHHENEIAQSKGHSGDNPSNYWMHSEFLVVNNEKMSKSIGNVYIVPDIIENGFSPIDFRYFIYTSNYRTKTNFTFEALNSAQTSLKRLRKLYQEHKNSDNNIGEELNKKIKEWDDRFLNAINDDLNTSVALSVLWDAARYEEKNKQIAKLIDKFDTFLSFDLDKIEDDNIEIPEDVIELQKERDLARKNKDFITADKLRDEILVKGFEIIDQDNGSKIIKK